MELPRGAGGALLEDLGDAIQVGASSWFQWVTAGDPGKLQGELLIQVLAALIVAAILFVAGAIGSRSLWRAIRLRWRAATIRKATGNAFVIVRCPIANDINDEIGTEISARLEIEFRAFAGWGGTERRVFEVMEFPLQLTGDEGTKAYDRAIETAKHWLKKTNGEVLIWGKRVTKASVELVRLIGKDRKKGVIETRRIEFDTGAEEFDQALAAAIAYEAARLTQVTLSEPESVGLLHLRQVASKLEGLARADAPALSEVWRQRMADEYRRLSTEIVRRTPSPEECQDLEIAARAELKSLDPMTNPRSYGQAALRVGILMRKKSWVNPHQHTLAETRDLLDRAVSMLESEGAMAEAAEAALERLLIHRLERESIFREDANKNENQVRLIGEADRLTKLAEDERQRARFGAAIVLMESPDVASNVAGFEIDWESGAFQYVKRIARHLDGGELIDLAGAMAFNLHVRGDRTGEGKFWRAGVAVVEAISNVRSSWTPAERRLLRSKIAKWSAVTGDRFLYYQNELVQPYYDKAQHLVTELIKSLSHEDGRALTRIEVRTMWNIGIALHQLGLKNKSMSRGRSALIRVVDEANLRFQSWVTSAQHSLIVALNNYAYHSGSLAIAQEAVNRATQLLALSKEIDSDRVSAMYVAAFAAWQLARLTPLEDLGLRTTQRDALTTLREIRSRSRFGLGAESTRNRPSA